MKKTLVFLIVFALVSLPCMADLIYLKDGKMIDAKIVKENDDNIVIEDGTNNYVIKRSSINRISYTKALKNEMPTAEDMMLAEFNANNSIKAMSVEMAAMSKEVKDMKQIMNIQLGIAIGSIVVAALYMLLAVSVK